MHLRLLFFFSQTKQPVWRRELGTCGQTESPCVLACGLLCVALYFRNADTAPTLYAKYTHCAFTADIAVAHIARHKTYRWCMTMFKKGPHPHSSIDKNFKRGACLRRIRVWLWSTVFLLPSNSYEAAWTMEEKLLGLSVVAVSTCVAFHVVGFAVVDAELFLVLTLCVGEHRILCKGRNK